MAIVIKDWAKSVKGQSIPLWKSADSPVRPILLIGGVHGDEPEGVALAEECLAWLKSNSAQKVTPWVVVPCLNPDGFAAKERTNGNGVDLNRNYPSRNWSPVATAPRYSPGPHPGSEPEVQALVKLISEVRPQLLIHCHSWKPCVVFTGEPARADALALARASGYEATADIGYPTTGSLSQYGWHDKGIPVICIEAEENSPLAEVWPKFKSGLVEIFTNLSPRTDASHHEGSK
jgi:protein MpaA